MLSVTVPTKLTEEKSLDPPCEPAVTSKTQDDIYEFKEEDADLPSTSREYEVATEDKEAESTFADTSGSTPGICLRRQPRRFSHAKPFPNGYSDRVTSAWLREHFYTKRGSLVPKGFLCDRYEEFCQTTGRKPMNNATLGRFIRGVFRGLETRRLGARQQSRYFYNNLAVRSTSSYASLMQKEMRPLSIRRHSLNDRSGESVKERIKLPPTCQSETICDVPSYCPRELREKFETYITEHREAGSAGGITDEELNSEFIVFHEVATANKREINKLFDPFLLDSKQWNSAFSSQDLPFLSGKGMLCEFLTDFRMHIGVLGSFVLTFNIKGAVTALEKFWLSYSPSGLLVPDGSYRNSNENARNLLQLKHFQKLIHGIYMHFYESCLMVFISRPYQPLDGYVWEAVYSLAECFGNCMERVTSTQPQPLHFDLANGAAAFCSYLRRLLNLNYHARYVGLLEKTTVSLGVLKAALATCLESQLVSGSTVFMERFTPANLQEILHQLIYLTESGNLAESWTSWLQSHINCRVVLLKSDDKENVLKNLSRDWPVVIVLLEEALCPFQSDFHIKPGFFGFLAAVVEETVWKKVDEVLGQTPLQRYFQGCKVGAKRRRDRSSTDATTNDVDLSQKEADVCSSADWYTKNEEFFRTFPELAEIVYDKIPEGGSAPEVVRVSNRAGKGRNRRLEEF